MATQTLTITGEGTYTPVGWADEGGTYARLQTDDGDTTRLYTPTNGSTRSLTHSAASVSGATINSLTIFSKVRNLNPISSTSKLGVRIGGTNYLSGNITNTGSTYVLVSYVMTTNPATGTAWTEAAINSAEFVQQKSDGIGTAWTYMYGEVDYSASAPTPTSPYSVLTSTGWKVIKPTRIA